MLLGLAGEEDDAEVDRLLQLRGQLLQHRDAAADVEAADRDRDALLRGTGGRSPWRGGTGSTARRRGRRCRNGPGLRMRARDLLDRNPDVHLVVGVDLDRDVLAEHLAVGAILRDGIEAGHRVRRDPGLPPLDDVALPVVVRRLDDLDVEGLHVARPGVRLRAISGSLNRPGSGQRIDPGRPLRKVVAKVSASRRPARLGRNLAVFVVAAARSVTSVAVGSARRGRGTDTPGLRGPPGRGQAYGI